MNAKQSLNSISTNPEAIEKLEDEIRNPKNSQLLAQSLLSENSAYTQIIRVKKFRRKQTPDQSLSESQIQSQQNPDLNRSLSNSTFD